MYGKPIELLYDKHKDKEIWVVGTGKSIDDFPENFFDDKITIGLNGAMCKYNNLNYYHYVHTIWFEYILNNNPEAISNSITWYLSMVFYCRDIIIPIVIFIKRAMKKYYE
jgi:hypothetical protein